jgi:hypothetical protein
MFKRDFFELKPTELEGMMGKYPKESSKKVSKPHNDSD